MMRPPFNYRLNHAAPHPWQFAGHQAIEADTGKFRTQAYELAKERLGTLEHYEMFGHLMALKSAENYRVLRKKGITIRRTADVVIATFCIENELPMLFSDRTSSRL
jgi:hypothetical protein